MKFSGSEIDPYITCYFGLHNLIAELSISIPAEVAKSGAPYMFQFCHGPSCDYASV